MKRSNHKLQGMLFVVGCLLVGLLIYQSLTGRAAQTTGNSQETYTMITDMAGTPDEGLVIENTSSLQEQNTAPPAIVSDESADEPMGYTANSPEKLGDEEVERIALYEELNSACRDSGNDPATVEKACDLRDRMFDDMKRNGLCLGSKDDASAADNIWHRCNDRSL